MRFAASEINTPFEAPWRIDERVSHWLYRHHRAVHLARTGEPVVEDAHSVDGADLRFPARGFTKRRSVRHVIALIPGARVLVAHAQASPVLALDGSKQFDQADGSLGPSADVERPSGDMVHVLLRKQECVNEIFDEEDVAHLVSVAINGERHLLERPDEEVRDPSLILSSELMGAVNATHAKHDRPAVERSRVVEHVLLGRAFGTSVGSVKRERPRLRDAGSTDGFIHRLVACAGAPQLQVFKAAVNLIRRCVDQRRSGRERTQGLQQVEGTDYIDFKIAARVDEAGSHGDLGGEMESWLARSTARPSAAVSRTSACTS